MVEKNSQNMTQSSDEIDTKKSNSSTEKAFDKVARLFKTNGIIYGNSVCNSSIKSVSSGNSDKAATK